MPTPPFTPELEGLALLLLDRIEDGQMPFPVASSPVPCNAACNPCSEVILAIDLGTPKVYEEVVSRIGGGLRREEFPVPCTVCR